MEWYWWVIIIVSVATVGLVLFMVLTAEEDQKPEELVEDDGVDIIDLSDKKVYEEIQGGFLPVIVGSFTYISAANTGGDDAIWHTNLDNCGKLMEYVMAEERPTAETNDAWNGDKAEEKDEKDPAIEKVDKDEKRLRDGHGSEEATDDSNTTYWFLKGLKSGQCTLQLAHADVEIDDLPSYWSGEKDWPKGSAFY